jgi:hypothetical protein
MKTFKQIDLFGQLALIITLTIVSLTRQDSTFIYAYCVVGGWQVVSMLIHQANKWHSSKNGRRYYYHRITAFTLLIMPTAFLLPPLFLLWYIMLFAAPVMAIYYTAICFREVFYPAKRPLELV